jgi:two-component system phosphate regulon sensor histidine kinase PhoR
MALFWRKSAPEPLTAHESEPEVPQQAVLDALPDAAGVLGPDGRFAAANAAMESLFGAGRVLGRSLLETTRSKELADALEQGPFEAEVHLPALQKQVLARARPLSQGRALLLLRDLTEAKRLEAVRRDFIANASHELRTPVSALKGAAETLLSMPLDADAKSFVHIVSRHAERLARLTQDLLDLSRLETGLFRPSAETLEVAPFVEGLLELFAEAASKKQIAVGEDIPPGLRCRADRRALEQILVNLLDNAVKYTPPGGRVTVLADDVGGAVEISVLDTGPGIEDRHRERIFERFYRADSGRARESGGTGLGLAIVKHLTQAQGGTVGVQSGRGGSRFWIRLPSPSSNAVVTETSHGPA